MPRMMHGESLSRPTVQHILFSLGFTDKLKSFGYMFPDLAADPASRLPEEPGIGQRLIDLGSKLVETANDVNPAEDSTIPAAYTYLGQFIDHDITLETMSGDLAQLGPDLKPISNPAGAISNLRTGTLDLDSVYEKPAPRDPANSNRMLVGKVTTFRDRPPGKDDFNDLPREGRNADHAHDRAALIGDGRNDENTIIAQLHTAFLRAHNALVAQNRSFDSARTELRRMYQSVVLDDFLPKIADPAIVNDVLRNGPKFWTPASADQLFMPFEFSAAAYRFGHSMVRSQYNFNLNFGPGRPSGPATLELLFVFTALSGNFNPAQGIDFKTLPDNWIIEWKNLIPLSANAVVDHARKINTRLAFPLRQLKKDTGANEKQPIAAQLAVRNLLRGYRLGLPTGQAIAQKFGLPVLSGQSMLDALPASQRAVVTSLQFHERSPLWFYILAEAGAPEGKGGDRLGPVGSRIISETFYNLAKFAEDSIIPPGGGTTWKKFTLQDILRLGGVA